MARNGSGTYARASASYVYNTIIDQVAVNAELDDIATALTNSLTKNGETTATANQPMGTYRHTGVGNGVARTDYAAMGQVQDGTLNWVDGGGTADAITATYSPAITALVDGQICCVRATAANATTTPTFAPNGLTARTIVKTGGVALVAGDIVGDGHELLLRYLLASTRWELLNPSMAGTYALLAGSASQAFARLAPSFSVHKNSADQTGIATTTYTLVTWSTELFDSNNNFASNRFTPTIAGKYQLNAGIFWVGLVDNWTFAICIYKNGALYQNTLNVAKSASGQSNFISTVVDANGTTDYFEVYAMQATGSNKDIYGLATHTFFNGCLIG